MEKVKRLKRVNLSESVKLQLQKVAQELKARGAKNFDMGEIIDKLFALENTQAIINEFVNDNTPLEYKVSKLMSQPEEKEQLLMFLKDKKFDLSVSGISSGS